jgi:hypothetical protein
MRTHQHQHAADVGMADDRHRRRRAFDGPALHAIAGVGHGMLVGALRNRQALQADGEARRVHHDEHVLEAFVFLADQGADRAAVVAVDHDAGRAGMDAQLVFDRHAMDVVALDPRVPSALTRNFGTTNSEMPLTPFGRIRRARQHQVDGVLRHVVVAVGDEYLLAEDW